ncbi:hypothetical protein M0804_002230 [Polistes exclamans]|nr:hypothetical protein M0804_002230 [Polistes exclamans]
MKFQLVWPSTTLTVSRPTHYTCSVQHIRPTFVPIYLLLTTTTITTTTTTAITTTVTTTTTYYSGNKIVSKERHWP